jgi:6-phosphofructokinase 2
MHTDILTVTLNPTLDVSTTVTKLIDHAKMRCTPEREQVGGGGINVAHVVHSLGASCQAMLTVGGLRGQDIVQRLTDNGLDCIQAPIAEQARQCFTVYESQTNHEYRFVLPGPRLSNTEQDMCTAVILQHLPAKYLVLSGSLPPGMPDNYYATVIRAVRQRNPNLRIVVDASGQALADALDAGMFLCKPSREEFFALTSHDCESRADAHQCVNAARELIKQDKTEVVALTLGADGSLIVTHDQAWRIDPLAVKVTSTVGAGDSFVGGFVWSMTKQDDMVQAAKLGTAAAAAALQTQGALMFDGHAVVATGKQVVAAPI